MCNALGVVQCIGGDYDHSIGECSVHWEDIISVLGGIISASGDIISALGGHYYCCETAKHPQYTGDIPTQIKIFPLCTVHILQCTDDIPLTNHDIPPMH